MHVSSKLVTFISLFWSTTRIRANIVQVPPDQGWFEASLCHHEYFALVIPFTNGV